MGIKDQNNMDNGYEKLSKDLKNLPKVNAPDDFEYKLMVKIQNGQFETAKVKNESGKLWKFIPATAVALSALIIFFVVQETSVNNGNPYFDGIEQPVAKTDNIPDTVNLRGPASPAIDDGSYLVIHPNDVVKKEKPVTARPRLKGVDVDGLIDGSLINRSGLNRQHVVGHGNKSFNGFLVDKDRKEIERLRARLDSIKAEKKKKIAN